VDKPQTLGIGSLI